MRHPASWEVTRLERDQIQWSDGDGTRAALEIRWGRHRGRYDGKKAFARFSRRARRKGLPRPEPWPIPQHWQEALSPYRVQGFSWRYPQAAGRGLLIFCPHCRRQSMLQIHPRLFAQPDLLPPLLESFDDHPHGAESPLALFGIRALLPESARLARFRFEAGRYRLSWRMGNSRIDLHRWAPAGILLEKRSLEAFTRQEFPMKGGIFTARRRHEFPAIEARTVPGRSWPALLRSCRFQRWVQVWHVADENTLLGVCVRGRGGRLTPLFKRLCDTYEIC